MLGYQRVDKIAKNEQYEDLLETSYSSNEIIKLKRNDTKKANFLDIGC